jgi:hypothetical protein
MSPGGRTCPGSISGAAAADIRLHGKVRATVTRVVVTVDPAILGTTTSG